MKKAVITIILPILLALACLGWTQERPECASTVAGSGVTGDLLAHNIDTAMWLNGPISKVVAMTETFIKERKHNLTGQVEPVGIDDASSFGIAQIQR